MDLEKALTQFVTSCAVCQLRAFRHHALEEGSSTERPFSEQVASYIKDRNLACLYSKVL